MNDRNTTSICVDVRVARTHNESARTDVLTARQYGDGKFFYASFA